MLSSIRTYALFERNRVLLVALIFLNISGFATSSVRAQGICSIVHDIHIEQWAIITGRALPEAPKSRIMTCDLPFTQEQYVLDYGV